MGKGAQTRARIIEAAAALFERQGYAATGLNEVLATSGAPRGSLYYHFPGGKEELAAAVVDRHAEQFGDMLTAVLASPAALLPAATRAIELMAERIDGAQEPCDAGCPVANVALEMAGRSEDLQRATRAAFEGWVAQITALLTRDGFAEDDAARRARALLSAIEGALILSRSYGDSSPLDDVIHVLPMLLSR